MRSYWLIHASGMLLTGMALASAGTPTPAPGLSRGEGLAARKLYVTKCAKCHQLYEPRKYSDADWKSWMQRMSRKSKLTAEQEKSLSDYINEQLRPSGQEKAKR